MSKLSLKVPPVAQGVIALMLIWLLDHYAPVYRIAVPFKGAVSLVTICIGSLAGLLAISAFIKLRTTVDPRYPDKASKLAITGIYKYSRNPMYLAILMVLAGIWLYSGALSSAIVLACFGAYINRFQIVPEEQLLTQKFGEQYIRYAQRVRRWL